MGAMAHSLWGLLVLKGLKGMSWLKRQYAWTLKHANNGLWKLYAVTRLDGMGWDGMGWDGMGWDAMGCNGMVIIGQRSFKSTFGANNKAIIALISTNNHNDKGLFIWLWVEGCQKMPWGDIMSGGRKWLVVNIYDDHRKRGPKSRLPPKIHHLIKNSP